MVAEVMSLARKNANDLTQGKSIGVLVYSCACTKTIDAQIRARGQSLAHPVGACFCSGQQGIPAAAAVSADISMPGIVNSEDMPADAIADSAMPMVTGPTRTPNIARTQSMR